MPLMTNSCSVRETVMHFDSHGMHHVQNSSRPIVLNTKRVELAKFSSLAHFLTILHVMDKRYLSK